MRAAGWMAGIVGLLAACAGGSGGGPPSDAADAADVADVADATDATDATDAPPPRTCSARAHGAKGDGVAKDTAALQAAVDACAGTGGVVVLEPGTYLSGSLRLKGGLTLRLEAGARLLGSLDRADYPDPHLLYAVDVEDLAIEGPGTIDGNGEAWWAAYALLDDHWRPHPMIRLEGVRRVAVRDVALRMSPGWHLHLLACDDVTVERVTIRATVAETALSPNTDGIDVDACRNVEIAHCDVETGDDAIVLKNSSGPRARASSGIRVHDCTVSSWANALKIGTRPVQPVRDVVFSDVTVRASVDSNPGTRAMAGLTLVSDDGAEVADVTAERIRMTAVQAPFFLRVQERVLDDEGGRKTQAGTLRGVVLRDVTVDDATLPGLVMGIPGFPVGDVRLERVAIASSVAGTAADRTVVPPERNDEYPDAIYFGTFPAWGLYARHVAGPLVLSGVTMTPAPGEARDPVVLDDVAASDLSGLAAPR